jgi:hypothetical protein
LKAAPEFSINPREVKRFMNVFRFQYFILLARRSKRLSVTPLDQFTRWLVLLLKWPDLIRWLQADNTGEAKASIKYELRPGKPTTVTGYRLMKLEELGRSSKD